MSLPNNDKFKYLFYYNHIWEFPFIIVQSILIGGLDNLQELIDNSCLIKIINQAYLT